MSGQSLRKKVAWMLGSSLLALGLLVWLLRDVSWPRLAAQAQAVPWWVWLASSGGMMCYRLAAELVEGLTSELLASRYGFWAAAGLPEPLRLEEAAARALAAEAGRMSRGARMMEALAGALMRRI